MFLSIFKKKLQPFEWKFLIASKGRNVVWRYDKSNIFGNLYRNIWE